MFVSYNVKDSDFVATLEEALAQAGHIVWDERKLASGADWVTEVEQAIDLSDVAILVVSRNYLRSSSIYEAGVLLQKGEEKTVRLVPLMIGDVENAEIPVRLQRVQFLDCRNLNSEVIVGKLISALGQV